MVALYFNNKHYLWKDMSLMDFLIEGNVPSKWKQFFEDNEKHLTDISEKLGKESPDSIYPPINQVFRSFIPLDKIRVVILGQDPYHNGSAVGYCFSVLPGNRINPSLKNIYKELKQSGHDDIKEDGILNHWVDQGCFMLNTALTVEKACPDTHTEMWMEFTENAIKHVSVNCKDVVWLLMGSKAQNFSDLIPNDHCILSTSHPSPFSAHRKTKTSPCFLGSGVFIKTNDWLVKKGYKKIKW